MVSSLIQERIFADIPPAVPTIGYFSDEVILKEYNRLVDKDYKGLTVLKPFSLDTKKQEIIGSNIPAKALLFQRFLKSEGYELSGLQELEDARAIHAKNPSCGLTTEGYCYVDFGVVVRKETERTVDLVEQLRKRNPKLARLKVPVAFDLNGLEIKIDGQFDGLRYVLTDEARIYAAPEYAGSNKSFSTVKNGRPVIQKSGAHIVYNNGADVSRFYLDSNLSVYARNGSLANSGGHGQVVLHRGAAANAKILKEYTAKLNAQVTQAKSELDNRYARALKVLRGEQ